MHRAAYITLSLVVAAIPVTPLIAQAPPVNSAPTFTVGTATARRGERATGTITVPAGVDSGYVMQVAVIHGARPGPVLALVSGQHGTEYSTIIGMQRLVPKIDPKTLAGTVIIIPVVNVPSFTSMTPARNPTDRKSMLGVWPGDSSGTQSYRAVAILMREVVNQANVIVDFHGGDLDEDIGIPFSAAVRGGRAGPDSESVRLAIAFGLKHIQIIDRDAASPRVGSRIDGQALLQGKPVILVGVGRSGVVTDGDIANVDNGCLNLLGALKMIDRRRTPSYAPVWLDAAAPRIAAQGPGAFFAAVPHGAMVKKGQPLGYTTDLLGARTGDVPSPIDGLVVYVHGVPSMQRGTTLAEVLPVLPGVPAWKAPARNRP
ncbi:MAG TPA: succinylglutamate desuccinylase/aspartoacylase family protein [Gemmatimonadales bacterium]